MAAAAVVAEWIPESGDEDGSEEERPWRRRKEKLQ